MILEELFFEIGAIIVVAAGLAMLLSRLRLPLVIAYIVTGIVVGPSLLAIAKSPEIFEAMSKIGVAFLLYTVGLGLNWRNVKDVGGIALATGVGQVLVTSVVGFVIGRLLGFDSTTSIYLAVGFSFSSTIIIVKLLSDKDELDTLYGRISVGFLLVQDFIAMFILLGLGAIGSGATVPDILTQTLIKIAILVPLLWSISTFVVPRLVSFAARSQELLFVFSIAWCFLIASVLVLFGFGVEMGALMAGVTLSGTVFEREINARIRPLRDFFLLIFFVVLGTHLGLASVGSLAIPTMVFSLYVLIGNPILAMLVMRALGYHPRTGFLSGTTVAQISEFSFIVIAAGIAIGHLDPSVLTLATAVGLITIATSSFMIQHNDAIYEWLRPLFRWLEPHRALSHEVKTIHTSAKVYLFGLHNIGTAALQALEELRQPFAVVDFDPTVVRELSEVGVQAIYGDVSDEGFLAELKVERASFIISTIPEVSVSLAVLGYLRSEKFKGTAIVSARTPDEASKCYAAGATYVIIPSILGGEKLREMLEEKKTRRSSWERLAQAARQSALS
jgi:Kef-type K+ transport system membrane component KefB